MKNIALFTTLTLGISGNLLAQDTEKNELSISGYAEVYYQHDFNNPKDNSRPGFVYSHNRNNEVSLNLGLIKASYETETVKATIGIGVGSYMIANYAAEEGVLKNIYEAKIGVKLSKKQNLWLYAGILPSHIGFESAIGSDCYTLSRSIMAENSPYFETGAKLAYGSANGKWEISVLALNGWQRIQRVDGNSTPAFGHQLIYRPNAKVTLNCSSFIGNDQPDEEKKMRYFHNLYGQFELSSKFSLIAGFDMGAQQKEKGSGEYDTWYTSSIIGKYIASEKISIAARGEYYNDKNGVIIGTGTVNGFQTFGASINVDYKILPNLVWRTEVKNFGSKDPVFLNRANEMKKGNIIFITSLAIRF